MSSGIIRDFRALVVAVAALLGAAILLAAAAAADGQDDKFFDLLGQKDIGAVDNPSSLIETGHKVCTKLDDGMSVGDLVELIRNNGFNENPMTRFYPQRRITATIDRFISAAVAAYCPYDQGKIAPIAGPAAWNGAGRRDVTGGVVLVSLARPLPSGEIPPTKPLPVPVQAPPVPEVPAPQPQAPPPPPPRHVQQAPQRQQQLQPPPQQVEPAPQAPAPAPEAPAPAPAPVPAEPPAAPPPPEPPAAPPPTQPPAAPPPPEPPPPSAPPPPPPPPSPPPEPKAPPGHIWLAP
jgi:hypothetical protein